MADVPASKPVDGTCLAGAQMQRHKVDIEYVFDLQHTAPLAEAPAEDLNKCDRP